MNFIKKLFAAAASEKQQLQQNTEPQYKIEEEGLVFSDEVFIHLKSQPYEIQMLDSALQQLEEEGFLVQGINKRTLTWDSLYELIAALDGSHKVYESTIKQLKVPQVDDSYAPQLVSTGSLSDPNFKVLIKGWKNGTGNSIPNTSRKGAVVFENTQPKLLSFSAWECLKSTKSLSQQQRQNPGERTNQLGWAEIRKYAKQSGADMDDFLDRSHVLKPDRLELNLKKSEVGDLQVLEIRPEFSGQPENWVNQFDKFKSVQDQYHIASQDGSIAHVLIEPTVKSVLNEIKQMPARKLSGDQALAMARNPYPFLGADAEKVIDSATHEKKLFEAGIDFYRFSVEPELSTDGQRIHSISVDLQPTKFPETVSETIQIGTPTEFANFVHEIRKKLTNGFGCGFWSGYELELSDLTDDQVVGLEKLSSRWVQESLNQTFNEVLDLSMYGDRVIGIGVADPVYSPHIPKENTNEWISPIELAEIGLDDIVLSKWKDATELDYEEFRNNIQIAVEEGKASAILPGVELELPIKKAELLCDLWAEKLKKEKVTAEIVGLPKLRKIRSVLKLKDNIEIADYIDHRLEVLLFDESIPPKIPSVLKAEIKLKQHQHLGLAWLQNLHRHAPHNVTGCLLADDMGLGKTLQILSFILNYLEVTPNSKPCLIVAPVSILENWNGELAKFFDNPYEVTLLYGQALADAKLTSSQIPVELQSNGIQNLLKRDWLGKAQIVITNYETLRDHQFSFAQQPWGIMVCDEAQKIKTPGTIVTDAIKAVGAKADFKVACTGTPVENTLIDLWCLFDFIQAGYLGAMNEFAHKFKKPIECQSEQDSAALDQLRRLIAPQILRRMKYEVADLPTKSVDSACRNLVMSITQQNLYRESLVVYEERKAIREKAGLAQGSMILGLLHELRMICAHPHGVEPTGHLLDDSVKMQWLFGCLNAIKQKNEKVIIFSDYREIQRDLQFLIFEYFDFEPKIVNGSTNNDSRKSITRQTIIDDFQRKPGFGVIILGTTAVGFGVNVQAANHVIHFTRPWNPAKEDQATDRAYRIGQDKPVYVYYPTVVSSSFVSFEKTLDVLLDKKRALAGDMLNGYDEIQASEFGI